MRSSALSIRAWRFAFRAPRSALRVGLAALVALFIPAGYAASPLWFSVTTYSDDPNVPLLLVQNTSRSSSISHFEMTIGDLNKGFDAAWVYPCCGSTPTLTGLDDNGDGGLRNQKVIIDFNPPLAPGHYFWVYVDVDDRNGNAGLDYRTVFFNNGDSQPNSEVTVSGSGTSASLTMENQGTIDQYSYFFSNQPTGRGIRVTSLEQGEGTEYVRRATVKVFNGIDLVYQQTGIGETTVINAYDGDTIEVSTPPEVYKDIHGADMLQPTPAEIQADAEEKFTAIGLSVNDVPQTGDPTYYRFTVTNDVYIVVKWRHDYALTVVSDFSLTQSQERDNTGAPWAGPLTSQAIGSPVPDTKKSWIENGSQVIAQIDGQYIDNSRPGLPLRHVPKAFRTYGPPNVDTDFNQYNTDRRTVDVRTSPSHIGTFPFPVGQVPPLRQQVREFNMYGPAGITYIWQIQYGVQVNADPGLGSLPKIFQVTDVADVEVANLEGTFWFDPGTPLKIASAANATDANSSALIGWIGGDSFYFSSTGDIDSSTGDLTQGGPSTRADGSAVAAWVNSFFDGQLKRFRGLFIPGIQRPAKVQWHYGTQTITIAATIGEYVFQHRPDYAAVFTNAPTTLASVGNPNVSGAEMAIWDANAAKLYPLKPGQLRATWKPDPNSANTVEVLITISYPSPNPHYRHVTDTPPVALDPDPNDDFIFKGLKHTENNAGIDGQNRFTASTAGKSVLLFSEIQRVGRGAPTEFLRVRVVESKVWSDTLGASDATKTIGQKITDDADLANLGTGYIVFDDARYNPFVYDVTKLTGIAAKDIYDMARLRSDNAEKVVINKSKLPGPIIPVNLHPQAPHRIVVVWYDDPAKNDGLLWPYTARRYLPRWPTSEAQGLSRIVIASQYGSESLGTNGLDQEVVPAIGTNPRETTFNPSRVQQVQVYHQPNRDAAGYNPNEEHGVLAPSLRFADVSPIPPAVYALRYRDLNTYNAAFNDETSQPANYTSHPYVLVQFLDTADSEFKMRVYQVDKEDSARGYSFANQTTVNTNTPPTASASVFTLNGEPHLTMEAGEPVIPFYPLVHVIGAAPCGASFGINLKGQTVYWEDHKGTSWSVSGGTNAWFTVSTHYPLAPDFYWPSNQPGFVREEVAANGTITKKVTVPQVGDCVAFLPTGVSNLLTAVPDSVASDTQTFRDQTDPIKVLYKSEWPANAPVLKAGETLTFSGGEFRADHPTRAILNNQGEVEIAETPGLPAVLAFASAEVVFDSLNPEAATTKWKTSWTARVAQVLDRRAVTLKMLDFPLDLAPATKRSRVKQGKYIFNELPASLQKRLRYDPLAQKLEMIGFVNEKDIGNNTLTASPGAVYILEPNIITAEERDAALAMSSNQKWRDAVNDLYALSRNPGLIDSNNSELPGDPSAATYQSALEDFWEDYYREIGVLPVGQDVPPPVAISGIDGDYLVGLEGFILRNSITGQPITIEDPIFPGLRRVVSDLKRAAPMRAFGPGLAVLPNPDFLNPEANLPDISWVSVVENNDPSLGGSPITIHVIQVSRKDRYRGAIKVVESDNVFDENLVLRHTGDFGANADKLFFEWWYRPDDGSLNVPPPDLLKPGQTNPWKLFPDATGKRGQGLFQITLKGNPNAPEALLADTFWFVRYRHTNDNVEGTNWKVPQDDNSPQVNFTWAGAGNSDPFNDFDGDGIKDYRAQLASGWIKRVLDAVNPFEARIRDFEGENPSTRVSMLAQFGQRYEGPVALNPDKDVIENVGLIELYETILKRGRDFSIDLTRPVFTPAIANALQLASTRISDFYSILGHEAYTDAQDPTIGFGSESSGEYGKLAPAVFCFQNQVSSLLEEELALLRGVDDYFARPVYNRLFWNFTKGEGEAAYAVSYDLSDVNFDGFIDEEDAAIMFPQGHGDAWGHYLTALRNQYELLKHPYFNWVSRSEFYNLRDIVIKVDFLDERKFAQAAAAKAKTGAEIVSLTYRDKFIENPTAQWQGYTDGNRDRAWGVDEWARRAGQGTYFDWVVANALLPAVHPNDTLEGIQKVDRTENSDITVVSANLNKIQTTIDQANQGQNPLGLDRDALVFDIDPTFLEVGSTAQIGTRAVQGLLHFDQIYERALKMLDHAVAVWDNANEAQNMLRQVGNSELEFRNSVFQEDLSYRNQLIKIFGKPYEGTIGPGKVYPAGYDGPDLLLFQYVDVRQIDNSTVPLPSAGIATFNTNGTLVGGDIYTAFVQGEAGKNLSSVPYDIRRLFSPSFTPDLDADGNEVANGAPFNARDRFYSVAYTDLVSPKVPLTNLTQLIPRTAAGYSFQAPRDWGQRLAVGELQLQINKMLQQEAAVASAIGAWDALSGAIVRQIRLVSARIQTTEDIRARNEAFLITKFVADTIIRTLETAVEIHEGLKETIEATYVASDKAVSSHLPTAGLAVSPGDALAPLKGAFQLSSIAVQDGLSASEVAIKIAKLIEEAALGAAQLGVEFANAADEREQATRELLVQLENLVGDEPIKRIEVFKELQTLREMSDEYRAMVDEGIRLIDERAAFNKRVAAQTQRNRYQDMTFRVARNHALENYRAAFDLAAKYSYLAAKAYDYETNFDPSDSGSPSTILGDIIRARTLGLFDSDPRLGGGGLSEALAKLKENYEVLKGQLGINNPQIEIGKASLRTEHFRILPSQGATEVQSVDYLTNTAANATTITTVYAVANPSAQQPETNAIYGYPAPGTDSDEVWRQTLRDAVVPDLWMVPEFRYYCRPFGAEDDGGAHVAEPGIVIRFSTHIQAGKNMFGKPLSGGDHAFDPTHFATKIQSAGVWFSDYLSSDPLNDLPATPRVYLVPVGNDIMSVPTAANPDVVRVWKVLDQRIPVPIPATTADLDNGQWIPVIDALNGRLGESRKYSTFRAYHNGGSEVDLDELVADTRLVARSVWNTEWLLIIPGRLLNADPNVGLDRFINQVTDIRIVFRTYGISGN